MSRADLAGSLHSLMQHSPCPVTIDVHGGVQSMPEPQLAAAWFTCTESLANIAPLAHASNTVPTRVTDSHGLRVEIRDDMRGGRP